MTHGELETLIIGLGTGEKNTALEVRTILFGLLQGIHQPGDIKPVYCTAADIANDYEATGLGIGKRSGWAICNGLNGTPPIGGRTIIGVGDAYSIGVMGGSKDAVVVAHSHTINQILGYGPTQGTDGFYDRSKNELPHGVTTDITGESGEGKNMQPFIALLYIQKKS
jgi:hypothetical protein